MTFESNEALLTVANSVLLEQHTFWRTESLANLWNLVVYSNLSFHGYRISATLGTDHSISYHTHEYIFRLSGSLYAGHYSVLTRRSDKKSYTTTTYTQI